MSEKIKLPREMKKLIKTKIRNGEMDIEDIEDLLGEIIQEHAFPLFPFENLVTVVDYREPFEIINPRDQKPIKIDNAEEILREVCMLILSFDEYIGLQIDEDFKNNLFNAQHHFADTCRLESSGKWRFTMGVQHTIRLTKLHALLNEATKEETSSYLKKLANRIYKKELRISKELGDILDIEEFLHRISKKSVSSRLEMDEMYILNRWMVISYIRMVDGFTEFAIGPRQHDMLWPAVLELKKQLQEGHMYDQSLFTITLNRDEKKIKMAEIDWIFKETFGFSFTSKEYQATTFIRGMGLNLIEQDIDPYTDGEELDQALLTEHKHKLTSCHNGQLIEDISNYLGHELFMRLKQLIITKDEIVNLYVFYEDMLMANSFSNMSFPDFLVVFLYFKSYAKDNEILYGLLFEGLKDTSVLSRLETMEKQFKKQEAEQNALRKKDQENSNKVIKEAHEKLQRAEAELARAQQSIKELEGQIEDTTALKREVLIHREYLYEQFQESQNEYIDQNQPLDQDYVSLLQEMDLQIVIIGGFPKFVQKWREAFPKIKVVGERDYHLTLNFLNKMDVIVFDAQYNNHSNFERVMAALTSDEPIFQLVRRTRSVDLLCKGIYQKLQERKQNPL